jgi:hypothetical protein
LLGLIGLRHDGVGESELGRLLEALLSALHWAHFTCQADLTKHHVLCR